MLKLGCGAGAGIVFPARRTGASFCDSPGKREQARGGRRELSGAPGGVQRRAARDPRRRAAPQNGSVEADAIADRARALAPVAERQPQHAGREAVRKTHRPGDKPPVHDDRRLVAFRDLRAGGILRAPSRSRCPILPLKRAADIPEARRCSRTARRRRTDRGDRRLHNPLVAHAASSREVAQWVSGRAAGGCPR